MKKIEWILTEQFQNPEEAARKAAFASLLHQYFSQALTADYAHSGAILTANQASYEMEAF